MKYYQKGANKIYQTSIKIPVYTSYYPSPTPPLPQCTLTLTGSLGGEAWGFLSLLPFVKTQRTAISKEEATKHVYIIIGGLTLATLALYSQKPLTIRGKLMLAVNIKISSFCLHISLIFLYLQGGKLLASSTRHSRHSCSGNSHGLHPTVMN